MRMFSRALIWAIVALVAAYNHEVIGTILAIIACGHRLALFHAETKILRVQETIMQLRKDLDE